MNKKFRLFPIALVSLFALSVTPVLVTKAAVAEEKTYYVDFFDNYARESFTLSSGYKGEGNCLLYKTIEVNENSLATKPEDPTRQSHDFVGWFKESECINEWNFASDLVTSNTRLFAKWAYRIPEIIPEPSYTPPSTVLDESEDHDFELYSIMNFKVNEYNILKVTQAAFDKLSLYKDDLTPIMEYKVKASKGLTATYGVGNQKITITVGSAEPMTINVQNDKASYVSTNSDYELKASKYEAKVKTIESENYHVMLAGSSSIEFWETSLTDMEPIVTYNHGIGGTTAADWTNKFNQRLVYPYKPKLVVYYVGINNIVNAGKTAEETITELEAFFTATHNAMPNTKIQYILLNLVPGFANKYNAIREVNLGVRAFQATHSEWLSLINPGDALLKPTGDPDWAYFRTDGLHLSYYGYTIWGGIIKEAIIEALENM